MIEGAIQAQVPDVRWIGAKHRALHTWYGTKKGTSVKYRWKQRPYKHQVAAVLDLVNRGWGGGLLMQARTGKTKVVIDYACILHKAGKINRVLVFMPKNVLEVWKQQLEANVPSDVHYRVTVWDRDGRRSVALPKFGSDVLDFVLVNYDALSTPPAAKRDRNGKVMRTKDGDIVRHRNKGGRYEIRTMLERWSPELLVLDESHRVKSITSAKARMIASMTWKQDRATGVWHPLIPYRVIMTGTPQTKKKRVFDLYAQWRILNPNRFPMTQAEFKHRYGRWVALPVPGSTTRTYDKWVRNIHEDELKLLIHKDSFAVTREECYDLPPKLQDRVVHVELEESGEIYDQMAEDMVARIHTGEITTASIALVKSLRLQQITSGIVKTTEEFGGDGRLVRIGTEKLRVLEDILTDLVEQDEKVIVGARFVNDIRTIEKLGQKMKLSTYAMYGAVKDADRVKNIARFKAEKGAALFVAQPSTAALGIDLREAGTTIWYSLTPSWVDWDQFNDRNALNANGTQAIYLLARGTVDELIYQTLLEDGDVGKRIIQSPEMLLRDFRN